MKKYALDVMAQILVSNQGNRITTELVTGILTSVNQALSQAVSDAEMEAERKKEFAGFAEEDPPSPLS